MDGTYMHRRQKHRWDDNIRMDLREIGWEGVDWICLALDRDHRSFCEHSSEHLDT
jgi:hypothetical protein